MPPILPIETPSDDWRSDEPTISGDIFGEIVEVEEKKEGWYAPVGELPQEAPERKWEPETKQQVAIPTAPKERAPREKKQTAPKRKPLVQLPKPVARTFQEHYNRWKDCSACALGAQRSQVVLYRGKMPCDVLYVGEAPGTSEDATGIPFDGPAGDLLNNIDKSAMEFFFEVRRGFCNLVACYPRVAKEAGTNEPESDEIKACAERLREIVHLAKPKLVVLVGGLAEGWFPRSCPNWEGQSVHIMHPAFMIKRMTEIQADLEAKRSAIAIKRALSSLPGFSSASSGVV